ncbi:glycosyltransferase family 2 protein [Rhizobium puerariae]|uniref:Glycosyltransferase family 2 protein n=1 Tax=Rhizobium puerariae TaxID=1585791 RepID=A0ABV6AJP3_9HYPH
MPTVAVVILTYNEEIHIARAIESVASFASEIFVIDSFSTDRTTEIAAAAGAVVLKNPFINYAKQFSWALENAPIASDWVMRLDADELISPELSEEIRTRLPQMENDVVGIIMPRKVVFLDRWVRFGGRYPLMLLRIWRRGHGRIEDRWMDEHMIVWGGRTVTFEGSFTDHNLNNLTFFIDKHNRYATREAIDVLNKEYRFVKRDIDLSAKDTSFQAAMRRFLKEHFYNRIPFQVSALSFFLYRYFIQLGFLDRTEGLIYHFLQGFWYRFLVGAKVLELRRAIAHLQDPEDIKAELRRITGLKIE